MPRLLQIDEEVLKEVQKVKEYASKHPYGEDYRSLVLSNDAAPVGDNPEHVIHIHDGYRAVYSISTLGSKRFHHLSISVEKEGALPSIPAAETIMELFDMGKNIHDLENVWLENNIAVNLLKEIEE